jgi:hypothetical protein
MVPAILLIANLAVLVPSHGHDEGLLPRRWGATGHQMAARAAVSTLPDGIPAFFREAGDQLVYLDPEPDRWRSRPLVEMDRAWSYDHYIDLENVPAGALDARDRFAFIRALHRAGIERPEVDVGFLPYRIVELYQRLVTEWRLWRAESDARKKTWIEQRIVNDAGILGHYVTDAANPHHTTIHFNGWNADAPNPHGYTTDRHFHARFETAFVEAHVRQADVDRRVEGTVRSVAGDVHAAVMAHVRGTHEQVETLYRLDKQFGFDPKGAARPETRDFAAERLAAGAEMLRTLWWSAWQESAMKP